jgi:mono/diheme cytochrome c family protein
MYLRRRVAFKNERFVRKAEKRYIERRRRMNGCGFLARGISLTVAVLALTIGAPACNGGNPQAPRFDPPATHTVVQGGVRHAPGLTDPTTNCVDCHGADLRGGPGGQPSCFLCHGRKWP